MKLTNHFTLAEATVSSTADRLGISNEPDSADLATIHRTAIRMERVREILGNRPITVNSWYRNEKVNKAVGGVPNSQHRTGEAVDFTVTGLTVPQAIQILLDHAAELQFDQLIKEPSWVHISFLTSHEASKREPRLQYLDYTK